MCGAEQRSKLTAGSSVALCFRKVFLREEERRDTVGSRGILTASLNKLFFIGNKVQYAGVLFFSLLVTFI